MSTNKTEILVYADWFDLSEPKKIGVLFAQQAKGKKAFKKMIWGSFLDNYTFKF